MEREHGKFTFPGLTLLQKAVQLIDIHAVQIKVVVSVAQLKVAVSEEKQLRVRESKCSPAEDSCE